MRIMVSACLLGENCKYNGKNNYSARVADFLREHEAVPVCPERLAGLGTPRTPIEIVNGVLLDREGRNVDGLLRDAADRTARQAVELGVDMAILQSRSPTCGVNQVYDGSFSGKLIPGRGVLAQALVSRGIRVLDAEDI